MGKTKKENLKDVLVHRKIRHDSLADEKTRASIEGKTKQEG
jgi:hypothetical protein